MTDLSKNIEALREKKAVIEMGGGEAAIEKQVDRKSTRLNSSHKTESRMPSSA